MLLVCSLWCFCSNTRAGCTWQLWSTGTGRQSSFPASYTYPKLLMDCGWEAMAQRFRLTLQQTGCENIMATLQTSEICSAREGGRLLISKSDDLLDRLWGSHTTAPLRALIFTLDWVPERELVGWMGGGELKQTTRQRCICCRSLFTQRGGKLADSILNCNVAEKCNCRKSIRAKSITKKNI